MKKLINDPRRVVREMLEGLADLYPGLALLSDEDVIVRADLPALDARQVAVLSGGGSGHEPAHAGYVGAGNVERRNRRRRVHLAERGCGARRHPRRRRPGRCGPHRQELHRRPAQFRPRRRARDGGWHPDEAGRRRRRRRAARYGRTRTLARHRRYGAGAQGGGCRRRGGTFARRCRGGGKCSGGIARHDGRRTRRVHRAGRGQARLLARRGRNGTRSGYPWRAGRAARQAGAGGQGGGCDPRHAARANEPGKRQPCRAAGERARRDAADGAGDRRAARVWRAACARHRGGACLGRQFHDRAGNAGLLAAACLRSTTAGSRASTRPPPPRPGLAAVVSGRAAWWHRQRPQRSARRHRRQAPRVLRSAVRRWRLRMRWSVRRRISPNSTATPAMPISASAWCAARRRSGDCPTTPGAHRRSR